MDQPPLKFRREFGFSQYHAWMALMTLGLGFISGEKLGLLAGLTAYGLGWIYLPDMRFFRKSVEQRHATAQQALAKAELLEFLKRRQGLLLDLTLDRRDRYGDLAEVCRQIEQGNQEAPFSETLGEDLRLRQFDELMWTFLRLLALEQSLETFVASEQSEHPAQLAQNAEADTRRLRQEMEASRPQGDQALLETKQRLLTSHQDRAQVLRKRVQRLDQAQANLALVLSEQERLVQQIKLLRADAMASRNSQSLTPRMDATVEHLEQTNQWLAEIDQFKELMGELPKVGERVGYSPTSPESQPPRLPPQPQRARTGQK